MPGRMELIRDVNGVPVQALRPTPSTAVGGEITGSSDSVAIPANAKLIRIAATGDCYINFGTVSVTAADTDVLFPTGVELFSLDPAWTHIAWINDGSSGGFFNVVAVQ